MEGNQFFSVPTIINSYLKNTQGKGCAFRLRDILYFVCV